MGSHLKADIDRIRESGAAVGWIRDEFDSAEATIDVYRGDVGDSELADKLHDFATNWKIHKDKICRDLDVFAKWASEAADAYDGTDSKLRDVLAKKPEGRP